MARGPFRKGGAALVALLTLLVAMSQALAGPPGDDSAAPPGVVHQLQPAGGATLPSRQPGYAVLHGAERSLQVVIGNDERQQVTNTSQFPNSAVTYIEAWKDGENFVIACSAAFVGPNVLLTAAHCLWIPEFGGFPDGVALAPGLNGSQTPFGIGHASELWVPQGWIDARGGINQGYPFDYGLIVLADDDLGNQVGAFSVGALPTDVLGAADFQPSTAGYPADKPSGTQWFGASDDFVSVLADVLIHDIDAFQGQSGSAVWRGSDLTVVGVVSFEAGRQNFARRITSDVLGELNAACDAMDCDINQAGNGSSPEPTATPTEEPAPSVTPEPSPSASPEPSPTEPVAGPQGDLGAFERTYRRTDGPVEEGLADRTWIWGPPLGEITVEPYDEAVDGQRAVRYHEKSRMEITHADGDPTSVWYVTNGLLARELVTGEMQVGDDRFEQRAPAEVNVAGDGDDPDAPTYASFLELLDAPPAAPGAPITALVDRQGVVGNDPELATFGVTAAQLAPETNHMVASVFWEFLTATGTVYEDGVYLEDRLFESEYFATGLPITEAYWAWVRVGGTERLVLVQVFERRVLTYTPGNPPGWEVEAGNVGSHYHQWRYGE